MGNDDSEFMALALDQARRAAMRGEVPVGAVLVGAQGDILASDGNRTIELHDPTAHAEILVMRRAGQSVGNYRFSGTTLYVTIEPCVMCAGAIVHARIGRVVYGADEPKAGGMVSCYRVGNDGQLNHTIVCEQGPMAQECSLILKDFFRARRKKNNCR